MTAKRQHVWAEPDLEFPLAECEFTIDRKPKLRIVGESGPSVDPHTAGPAAGGPSAADRPGEPLFDFLEEKAIGFGATDPLTALDPNCRVARILVLFFGLRFALPLADPRLESLRRLVLALRGRPDKVGRAIEAAEIAGISRAKVECLLSRDFSR